MRALEYPFDADLILSQKKRLKRELLSLNAPLLEKKIAILGGSTTDDIKLVLELFLLNYGIKPVFYESEYNRFYEDAIFENPQLQEFKPDIIYIHTTNRNLLHQPHMGQPVSEIYDFLETDYGRYQSIWEKLKIQYRCPIIQNNFEYPYYRLLGNKDASDIHGFVNYITRLNMKFYEYAQCHDNFYINDINWISADYGLERWSDQFYWYMYKYALAVPAIPYLSFNVANIIKSIFGKNKKGFVLDLDNTLWGGVIGDDGVEHIELGPEEAGGLVFTEVQRYIKSHKKLGVILNIDSKNDYENALVGLAHPDSELKKEDFVVIKANWNPKDENFREIAEELNLLPESLVFVDDNPAEREIVCAQIEGVSALDIGRPEQYISRLSRAGYFEITNFSEDDAKRSTMYQENAKRTQLQKTFANYEDYLRSLEMKATIKPFDPTYMVRIAQLTNKSNQFNLTTRRYSVSEIEQVAANKEKYITLYGKLEDKFGDNGVVSVVISERKGKRLDIILWLMSCRVLKRDMEFAMMDTLVAKAQKTGVDVIHGFYYPTNKNKMVQNFYELQGFHKVNEDECGNTEWELCLFQYMTKNKVIEVED